MMFMQKIAAENRHSETALWSPVLMAILTCVGSRRWWKMTCAAMQPWLLRMHFRCVDMTPGPVRFHTVSGLFDGQS